MFLVLADNSSTDSSRRSEGLSPSKKMPKPRPTTQKKQNKREKEKQRLQRRRAEVPRSTGAADITSETAHQPTESVIMEPIQGHKGEANTPVPSITGGVEEFK